VLIAHVLQSLTDELPGDPATLEAGLHLGVGERHQLGCRDVVGDGCQHAVLAGLVALALAIVYHDDRHRLLRRASGGRAAP